MGSAGKGLLVVWETQGWARREQAVCSGGLCSACEICRRNRQPAQECPWRAGRRLFVTLASSDQPLQCAMKD